MPLDVTRFIPLVIYSEMKLLQTKARTVIQLLNVAMLRLRGIITAEHLTLLHFQLSLRKPNA